MLEKEFLKWYYVPTKQNSADIGSSLLSETPCIWWKGLSWIAENNNWPYQPILSKSRESEKEAKTINNLNRKVYLIDLLLDKYELHNILRVSAWVARFINNCQKTSKIGPLATSEIQCQEKFYIKRE